MQIAIVSSQRAPKKWPDTESPVLIEELRTRGATVEVRNWYDPSIDWRAYDFVLVRSPWCLYWHFEDFKKWLERIEAHPAVGNPASVMRWSLDKHYLWELIEAGLSVTPTTIVEPGQPLEAFDRDVVIKPTVSGGATDTARWTSSQLADAKAHVQTIHQRGLGAMVQPYLHEIDYVGERGLIFFGGAFSHAIAKDPLLKNHTGVDNSRLPHPKVRRHHPSDEEMQLAQQALALIPRPRPLTFARVDMVPTAKGPVLLELEVLDASTFPPVAPESTQRFADAVLAPVQEGAVDSRASKQ